VLFRSPFVPLLNPLSEDQSVLRTMLLPGLLDNVRRNINFQKTSIRLFEIGKVFTPTTANTQPIERTRLAGMLAGNRFGENSPLYHKPVSVDIFDAKGVVEYIIHTMALQTGIDSLRLLPTATGKDEPFAQSGYSLSLVFGEQQLGSIGKISENVLRNFNIKHEVYFFDLDYDSICALPIVTKAFTSLPIYPSVKRDIALVVPDYVSAGEMLEMIGNYGDKLIERFDIFDVFKGDKIPAGHKSVALTITYRSQTKTLTEKNVEKSHSKIVSILTDKFGGSLRNA
jgi:phenylalanyl-tRNA synthetase beta chain